MSQNRADAISDSGEPPDVFLDLKQQQVNRTWNLPGSSSLSEIASALFSLMKSP